MSGDDASDDYNLKRQRISRACDLCRRKKIKCDGLVPICTNCQAFSLECSYKDMTKKRGPPKGYIEAIENRLHKLEQVLAQVAEDSNDPRSRALLAELHTPLETQHGEQISTRPVRRGRGRNKKKIDFLWQQAPVPHSPSFHLMESDAVEEKEGSRLPGFAVVSDSHGQLSMDESGEVRFLGKSSGFYLLQESRAYQNGAFHLADFGHKSSKHDHPGPLDPFELPPKDLSDHLLDIYFNHFYPALPLFFKKRLTRSENVTGAVSPLLLNAIFAVAARMSPDPRVRADPSSSDTAGDIYFERAKCLLDNYYDSPRVSTVQALLLLAIHQQGSMRAPRAWLYSGLAFRMAQDLGLHRNCEHWDINPDDRERRKRVFWCCFVVDRLVSATFGRAFVFEERDCDVPFPSVDDDEPATKAGWPPVRLLDAFVQLIKVCDILGHVLKSIYYAKSRHSSPGAHHIDHALSALNHQLTTWYKNIPKSLQYDLSGGSNRALSEPPAPISHIHMIYYTTVILLHRPFIPAGSSSRSYTICASAADSILEIVDIMHNENRLKLVPNSTVYFIFTAGIIFLKSASSEDPQRSLDAKVKINKIMRALDEIELTWPTASRTCDILGELAGLRDINLEYEGDSKRQGNIPALADIFSNSSRQQQQNDYSWSNDQTLPRFAWMQAPSSFDSCSSTTTTSSTVISPSIPTADPFAAPGTMTQVPLQSQYDPLGAAFWGVPTSLDMNEWNQYLETQGMVSNNLQQPASTQPLIPSHEFQPPRFLLQQPAPLPTSPESFLTTNPKQHLVHSDEGGDELSGVSENHIIMGRGDHGTSLLGSSNQSISFMTTATANLADTRSSATRYW